MSRHNVMWKRSAYDPDRAREQRAAAKARKAARAAEDREEADLLARIRDWTIAVEGWDAKAPTSFPGSAFDYRGTSELGIDLDELRAVAALKLGADPVEVGSLGYCARVA